MQGRNAKVPFVLGVVGAILRHLRRKERSQIMQVQPYLFFDGRCDEALEFYKKTIGADVKMVMR
jgi:hypothetical protein